MHARTKGLLFAIPILLIIGLLWIAYFYFTLSPIDETAAMGEPILIQKGDGLTEIAEELEAEGFIRSASAFKFYTLLTGTGHKLKPGLYTVSKASSTSELVKMLVAGPSKEIRVLITEGQNMPDIDRMLSKLGIIEAGEIARMDLGDLREQYPFLAGADSLEGYLFPDTYRFYFDSSTENAVRPFLENFRRKVEPLVSDGQTADYENIPIVRRGIYSINDVLIVASFLEKEVPDAEERRLVADIIYRRLKEGMPLQIDASVDYAKQVNDPRYDTYEFKGLPPGPIANPGVGAITAALNPKANQYVYYLSDPKTKKTIFAKTFEEHKANKEKYLR